VVTAKSDLEMLQDIWSYVPIEQDGAKQQRKRGDDIQTITFQGDKFEVKRGGKVIQAGTQKLDPGKNPKTIDANITEGEGKGTVLLGIYELNGDALTVCFDPQGKKRPTELKTTAGSGYLLVIMQREKEPGLDPKDTSIVYDRPHQMTTGLKGYNGRAYDKAALYVEPKAKVVLPTKETEVRQHGQADVLLIYMEKRMKDGSHGYRPLSIADKRKTMGCAVKLEKGALLIGTFGERGFFEGAYSMKLLVLVPPQVEVERRVGLTGGYSGRAGQDRSSDLINPKRGEPIPALTKLKKGTPEGWLPPTAEDGWHEIPAVADVERRVSKEGKEER
jgi:uncharacterized protein (TIGR03067 family)